MSDTTCAKCGKSMLHSGNNTDVKCVLCDKSYSCHSTCFATNTHKSWVGKSTFYCQHCISAQFLICGSNESNSENPAHICSGCLRWSYSCCSKHFLKDFKCTTFSVNNASNSSKCMHTNTL